jgi:protein arginine kinase
VTGNGKEGRVALDRLQARTPFWASELGPMSSVILSSRVRLARNLASLPFPSNTSSDEQQAVIRRLQRAVSQVPDLSRAPFIFCESLDKTDLEFLVERRLVSRDLAHGSRHRGVVVGDGECLTIMVNEEDHFRFQSIVSGLRLGEALDRISEVDNVLDAGLEYAFSDELGFLTACPTNVGTGMRASVLAHLPALVLTRRAKKVMQSVSAMGLAVRGFYGEGTEIMGNFFQISNQTTLGKGENEIVSRLEEVVGQIIGYEDDARDTMWRGARIQLEDKIYRAFGTLQSARSISAEEVVSLASAVRFGIAKELGGLCSLEVLNQILIHSQPGHITRRAGREITQEERRKLRADTVRQFLTSVGGEPLDNERGTSVEPPPRKPAEE